jgi:hypothetical protein
MEEDIAWRRIFYGRGYCLEEDIAWRRIFYGRGYPLRMTIFRACLSSPFADTRAEPAYAMYKLTYKIAHDAFHASWATWNFTICGGFGPFTILLSRWRSRLKRYAFHVPR